MLASGWLWLIAAIVLGVAETILPGFILLGFSIGALVTALALFFGLISAAGWILLVFAVGSLLGWLFLRYYFRVPGQKPKIWKTDINDN